VEIAVGPTGSVIINNGDALTNSTSVNLTLSADDPGSGIYKMCLRNSLSSIPACFDPLADPPIDEGPYSSCSGSSDLWDPIDGTYVGATVLAEPLTCEQMHCPHTVSTSDPEDWFKVYLTANNTYNFNAIGDSGNYTGGLYIDDGEKLTVVAWRRDDGGFSIDYTPTITGWYYLKVRCWQSNYNCSYTLRYRVWSDSFLPCGHSQNWTLPPGDGIKTVYVKFMDNVGHVSTYSDSIILDTTPVAVINPNGGEIIPAGSQYSITWSAPANAVKFDLYFSYSGTTANRIAIGVKGTSFPWTVPTATANKTGCLVKVIAYDANGRVVGEDVSNGPFTIEVVKVTSPNGGENWKVGFSHAITWTTYKTKNPVAQVKLFYTTGKGIWNYIKTVVGNPGTANWTVPAAASARCKVKVVLQDALGKTMGTDMSDSTFTIGPYYLR
jgi:hypothetical protein